MANRDDVMRVHVIPKLSVVLVLYMSKGANGCLKPIEDGRVWSSKHSHIYKETWTPFLMEHLECKRKEGNNKDRYAVVVLRHDTVGHIARRISAACSLFIQKNGSIKCTITGTRQYSADLPQGGLEIPCLLTFRGDKKEVMKVRKLLGTKLQVPESNVSSPSKKWKLDVCIIESSMPETQVIDLVISKQNWVVFCW